MVTVADTVSVESEIKEARNRFCGIFHLPRRWTAIKTPSVAVTESQKPTSNTEVGEKSKIPAAAANSDVIESFPRAAVNAIKAAADMIVARMTPALAPENKQ